MPMWADMGFTLSGLKLVEDMENTQGKTYKDDNTGMQKSAEEGRASLHRRHELNPGR